MDRKILNYAGGAFLIVAAIYIIYSFTQPGWFQDLQLEVTEQPYAKTFTVTGEGEITAKPDMAVVNLSVIDKEKTVKEVTQKGNEKMGKVIAAVKSLGVSEDDIKTTQYNLYPSYHYPRGGEAVLDGYELNQTIRVEVKELTKVEDVLDKGVQAGANQVGQISFEIDDDSEQRNQAREEAFADARRKAEQMAKAAGVRLGDVITFSESEGGYPPTPVYRTFGADMAMEEAAIAPAIEPGSQDVNVIVSVTYEIN
jgi:uncharacterized protein YggE